MEKDQVYGSPPVIKDLVCFRGKQNGLRNLCVYNREGIMYYTSNSRS